MLGIDWRSVNSGVHIRRPDEDTDVAFCRSSALWTNSSRHHRWPPGSSSRELFITFSSLQHFLRFWYPLHCLYVPWQNWMAASLGYTLRMKTLFRGRPVMVHDTHMRRRRRMPQNLVTISRTWFKCLDSHWRRVVPDAFVHLAKLSWTNLPDELQRTLRNFPLIFRVVRQADRIWLLNLQQTATSFISSVPHHLVSQSNCLSTDSL